MRFMLLIYDDAEPDRPTRSVHRDEWRRRLTVTGEWVSGRLLADACLTRTVRVGHGDTEVRSGGFTGAGRRLVGCFEVECESFERAVRIAAEGPWPARRTVEVRPLMDEAGLEM